MKMNWGIMSGSLLRSIRVPRPMATEIMPPLPAAKRLVSPIGILASERKLGVQRLAPPVLWIIMLASIKKRKEIGKTETLAIRSQTQLPKPTLELGTASILISRGPTIILKIILM